MDLFLDDIKSIPIGGDTRMWVEKYRPNTLEQVEGNTGTIRRLQAIARDGNMPNLLLTGPPGTGKTSSILALARTLLGDLFQRAVLEINASDDRGIDVVRERIKAFAKEKISLPQGKHKIVMLDEVDSMTEAAQQALRRLMEVHSDSTRFALACNTSTKIIEPIQSRCAIIRVGKLKDEQILKRLLEVCRAEKVNYVDSGLETLIFTADGDLRTAINNLQAAAQCFGIVNKQTVSMICDIPSPELVMAVVEACLDLDFRRAHTIARDLISDGYTALDVVSTMRGVVRRLGANEHLVLEYMKLVGRYYYLMLESLATTLQLDALLADLVAATVEFRALQAGSVYKAWKEAKLAKKCRKYSEKDKENRNT